MFEAQFKDFLYFITVTAGFKSREKNVNFLRGS